MTCQRPHQRPPALHASRQQQFPSRCPAASGSAAQDRAELLGHAWERRRPQNGAAHCVGRLKRVAKDWFSASEWDAHRVKLGFSAPSSGPAAGAEYGQRGLGETGAVVAEATEQILRGHRRVNLRLVHAPKPQLGGSFWVKIQAACTQLAQRAAAEWPLAALSRGR